MNSKILCSAAIGLLVASPRPGLGTGSPRLGMQPQNLAATQQGAAEVDPVASLVEAAMADGRLPGAVVLAGSLDGTLYRGAVGHRSVVPQRTPMTLDTVFDLASLTKVVATTTSIMILVEEGRLRLRDPVTDHLPGFGRYGKDAISIGHLLTHMSGLRPDVDLEEPWTGYETAMDLVNAEVPVAVPDARFIYSDINFVLLGDIVSRVSGMPLDRFARERIFEPLGMGDTGFNPPASLRARIAPSEPCPQADRSCDGLDDRMLRGVVHDPTSRRMGGVAGHAGLFGTAADLAIFCRMLLGGGTVDGTRILSPLSVARMTSPATPPGEPNVRGLGWDIGSVYSANRGELFPPGSFGHTGFTGTSLWIDPSTRTFVVFLSSRLHPDGGGDVTPLRARVATVVAASLPELGDPTVWWQARSRRALGTGRRPSRQSTPPVRSGLDVLRAEGFARLRGKRIGLVTNQSGTARDLESVIDLLWDQAGLELVALFSPEHGIRGGLDAEVPSSTDPQTGLPVHSLYGETRRPTTEMLTGIDTLVVDLQDVGARFYTYASTMAYAMEEAAARDLQVVVLDRPNPINGFAIEGPTLESAGLGFTGYFPMPVRHGLTLGEVAHLLNAEAGIGADLTVVAMQGWRRDFWFDQTGLPWLNPSPNIRDLTQATLYPGIGAIEGSNISVGRGTDSPFEQVGAPWIDGSRLAEELNRRGLRGVRFYPVSFTPASSKYRGERCHGVFVLVTDRVALAPVRVGLEIATALSRLHPDVYDLDATRRLLGSAETIADIRAGKDPAGIANGWRADEARWRRLRAPYLLYP